MGVIGVLGVIGAGERWLRKWCIDPESDQSMLSIDIFLLGDGEARPAKLNGSEFVRVALPKLAPRCSSEYRGLMFTLSFGAFGLVGFSTLIVFMVSFVGRLCPRCEPDS